MLKKFLKENELGRFRRYADRKDEVFFDINESMYIELPVEVNIFELDIDINNSKDIYLYVDYTVEKNLSISHETLAKHFAKFFEEKGLGQSSNFEYMKHPTAVKFKIDNKTLNLFLKKFKEERNEDENDPLWLIGRDYDL